MQRLNATILLGISSQDEERVCYNYRKEATEPDCTISDNHMVDECSIKSKFLNVGRLI